MPYGLPGQRDGTSAIDQRGADQDKRREDRGIERHIQVRAAGPITQGSLEQWPIPLVRPNSWVVQEAGKAPNSTGSVLGATVHDFGPGAQANGLGETQA